jgi:hypothetical protein
MSIVLDDVVPIERVARRAAAPVADLPAPPRLPAPPCWVALGLAGQGALLAALAATVGLRPLGWAAGAVTGVLTVAGWTAPAVPRWGRPTPSP